MENINLAEIYEALKQHEAALRELTASVGAITAFLKGSDPFGKIQTDRLKRLPHLFIHLRAQFSDTRSKFGRLVRTSG